MIVLSFKLKPDSGYQGTHSKKEVSVQEYNNSLHPFKNILIQHKGHPLSLVFL